MEESRRDGMFIAPETKSISSSVGATYERSAPFNFEKTFRSYGAKKSYLVGWL